VSYDHEIDLSKPIAGPPRPQGRPWLRPPQLRTSAATAAPNSDRHASWLELFFDLVFVVAIAQLAQELVHDHTLGGFAIFAGLFLPVFIAWQGFTFYADRFDTDDVLFRVVMLAGMLAIAALAVQIPDVAAGERAAGFVVTYATLRLLVIALYLRAWKPVPDARALIARYAGGYSISVGIWLGSLFVDPPGRYVMWGIGLAIEYAMPVLAQRLHSRVPVDSSHVPERFALFTIIVLGESVVAVALGTADNDWRTASVAVAAAGFVFVACLWWVYFDRGIPSELSSRTGSMQLYVRVHIPLLGALTAVGAGVHMLIDDAARGELDAGAAWALAGGAALYLLCLSVAWHVAERDRGSGMRTAQVLAGATLIVLAVSGGSMTAVSFTVCSTVVVVALVVYEVQRGVA
jgi:low temperature requirement protein LtrA